MVEMMVVQCQQGFAKRYRNKSEEKTELWER